MDEREKQVSEAVRVEVRESQLSAMHELSGGVFGAGVARPGVDHFEGGCHTVNRQ